MKVISGYTLFADKISKKFGVSKEIFWQVLFLPWIDYNKFEWLLFYIAVTFLEVPVFKPEGFAIQDLAWYIEP